MTATPTSNEYHVARHCRKSDVDPVERRPSASAFELKHDEDYLSVNCPEIFPDLPDLPARLKRIIHDLGSKPRRRIVRPSHWFAVLPVKRLTVISTSAGRCLRVTHEEETGDVSHCGIYGLRDVEELERNAIQLQIAVSVQDPVYLVSDL